PSRSGAGSRWPPPRNPLLPSATRDRPPSCSSRTSLLRRGLLDRGANARVGAAATDVAAHRVVDLLVGRLGGALEQRRGRHDLAGLAVTALGDTDVGPRRLQGLADRVGADPLDRDDLP